VATKKLREFAVPLALEPMEAKRVEALPKESGWQFEPKWDGFRCLAFRAGDHVELQAKSGKSLSRYFPEMLDQLRGLKSKYFVIDGELAIPQGAVLSFDALQARLHPADSRIRRLSVETPAVFIVFDCLAADAKISLIERPLKERRIALEKFFQQVHDESSLRLSPYTRDIKEARAWLERAAGSLDGIVAKRVEDPYRPGERRMLKVKRLRTADCVVGGFRYASDSREVGSLLLGLYNEAGKLDHVGFTSSFANEDREALTRKLEKLIGKPGFTGDAPGGPSRWSTERSTEWQPLKTKLVVEVSYDQVSGQRFRHGTRLLRWRPDKAPGQCTFEQLEEEKRPAKLVGQLIAANAPSATRRPLKKTLKNTARTAART
jgi:ATP-dependent DNA ligase